MGLILIFLNIAIFLAALTFFYEGYKLDKRFYSNYSKLTEMILSDNSETEEMVKKIVFPFKEKLSVFERMKFTPDQYVEILKAGYNIEYVNSEDSEGNHDYWKINNQKDKAILVIFYGGFGKNENEHTLEEFKKIISENKDMIVIR